jgi:hypothetical protein
VPVSSSERSDDHDEQLFSDEEAAYPSITDLNDEESSAEPELPGPSDTSRGQIVIEHSEFGFASELSGKLGMESDLELGIVTAPVLPRPQAFIPDSAVVLTVLVTVIFLMFLLTEPTQRWIALFGAGIVAIGTDGVLRRARSQAFALGLDTTPQLFLPTLYACAFPVFIENNAQSVWVLLSGLVAGLGFGIILLTEVHSVRAYESGFDLARIVCKASVYLTAFAIFSLSYTFTLELGTSIIVVSLIAGLLSIELLRDVSLDPRDTLIFAGVLAFIIGELRWALHFVPLDGHLAALMLVIVLFFSEGLLYAQLRRQLTRVVLFEYVAAMVMGLTLVAVARVADLA